MREPPFWWAKPGIAATLLAPLAAGYGAVAAARLRRSGRAAGIPVLCIGNLTLGGAGKTPTAIAVARMLIAAGERPFFLSRGYGGLLAGPVCVDRSEHRAGDVGDEPLLLARVAPAIVSRDRFAGAQAAQSAGASVIVMDDGLQNSALVKDLTIAVVDGRRGIGNGRIFPAGPLRAPLTAQLARADALLVVGEISGAAPLAETCADRGMPVFRARLEPDRAAIAALKGSRVLAFAGIGDPEKFFATLAAAGVDAPVRRGFADHHRYSPGEAAELAEQARTNGLICVTTEKDWVRLAGDEAMAPLAALARALPVALVLDDEAAFRRFLLGKIGKA